MDNFWTWMENNNYGYKGSDQKLFLYSEDRRFLIPTKKMLIGYMIEYLLENIEDNQNRIYPEKIGYSSIDDLYDNLELIIIEHDGSRPKEEWKVNPFK